MAKSEKQKQKDSFTQEFWDCVARDVEEQLDSNVDPDNMADWDNVVEFLTNNSEQLCELVGKGHESYEGKLTVTAVDRRKILDEVEGSCLSERAKRSFVTLLKG